MMVLPSENHHRIEVRVAKIEKMKENEVQVLEISSMCVLKMMLGKEV